MPISPTWAAYKHLTEELREQRGELAELLMAEQQARVSAYGASAESSVSGRDREAKIASLDLTLDILNVKAKIEANEDLRVLLQDAVRVGVEIIGNRAVA